MDGAFQTYQTSPCGSSRDPYDEVVPGVIYGKPEWVFSPSYWEALVSRDPSYTELFRRPTCLIEEVSFCLLGGFGIKAEVNCAAFRRLQKAGVFRSKWKPAAIEKLLREPLQVEDRLVRYRFPSQRAHRIATAVERLTTERSPTEDAESLRIYLLGFPGIGPKTASWITRNWLDTDDVAIIDIHVERAGRVMGLFHQNHSLPRDYLEMERRFLAFAESLNVRASALDVAIWSEMRKAGTPLSDLTTTKGQSDGKRRGRRKHRDSFQEAETI